MNWPHLHLALNHFPVLGTVFITLLLLVGLWRASQEILRLSLWAFVGLTVISIPIKFTGDFAHEQLVQKYPLEEALVKPHEDAADRATTCIFLLGLAAGTGLFAARAKAAVPRWASTLVLVLALLTGGMMAWTANLGGKIRHPEIRGHVEL